MIEELLAAGSPLLDAAEADPHLRLWLSIIAPNRPLLQAGRAQEIWSRVRDTTWRSQVLGPRWEAVVRDHIARGDQVGVGPVEQVGRGEHRLRSSRQTQPRARPSRTQSRRGRCPRRGEAAKARQRRSRAAASRQRPPRRAERDDRARLGNRCRAVIRCARKRGQGRTGRCLYVAPNPILAQSSPSAQIDPARANAEKA